MRWSSCSPAARSHFINGAVIVADDALQFVDKKRLQRAIGVRKQASGEQRFLWRVRISTLIVKYIWVKVSYEQKPFRREVIVVFDLFLLQIFLEFL